MNISKKDLIEIFENRLRKYLRMWKNSHKNYLENKNKNSKELRFLYYGQKIAVLYDMEKTISTLRSIKKRKNLKHYKELILDELV